MRYRPLIALLSGMLFVWSALLPSADAWWFSRKKKADDAAVEKVRTYQPPPENAVTVQCDPYRRQAALLGQKPLMTTMFYIPKRLRLQNKYRTCKSNLMEQERIYLKHVDIEQAPSLPKMKMEVTPITPVETAPKAGGGNVGK